MADRAPTETVPVHFRQTRPAPAVARPTPQATLVKKLHFGIKELLHFAVTTTIIFLAIFFALNYSAYEKKASYYLETGGTADLAADLLTSHNAKLPTESTAELPSESIAKSTESLAPITMPETTGGKFSPLITTVPHLSLRVTPPDNRIVIPKLKINAPIVETADLDLSAPWKEIEQKIQAGLHDGVVHVPGTAAPGSQGNAFITGHSSYYPWDDGKYKDIFALLPEIQLGDRIIAYYDQKKYIYEVTNLSEVNPKDVFVLGETRDTRLTLMTCIPVGTTLRRLIVTTHLVDEE